MMEWGVIAEPFLFPPVTRFFIALLLIVIIQGISVVFGMYLVLKLYGEPEEPAGGEGEDYDRPGP